MRTNELLHEGSKPNVSLEDTSGNLFLFGNNAVTLASDGVVMPIATDWCSLTDEHFRDLKNELEVAVAANKPGERASQCLTSKNPLKTNCTRSTKTPTAREHKRCSPLGCQKFVQYQEICDQHSERICSRQGCGALAGSSQLCPVHSKRTRCSHPDCSKSASSKGVCSAHGGFKPCSHPGCAKHPVSKGLCHAHGGGRRCSQPDCLTYAISKGLCHAHGGGIRCSHPDCSNGYALPTVVGVAAHNRAARSPSKQKVYAVPTAVGLDVHNQGARATSNPKVYALPTAVGFGAHIQVVSSTFNQKKCAGNTAVRTAAHIHVIANVLYRIIGARHMKGTNELLHEGSKRSASLEDTSGNLFLFGNDAVTLASDGVVMPIAADFHDQVDTSEPEVDNPPDDGTQYMTSKTSLEANHTRSKKETTARKRKRCSHVGCQNFSQYQGRCGQHCGRICSHQGCGALAGSKRKRLDAPIPIARSLPNQRGYAAPMVDSNNAHVRVALNTSRDLVCVKPMVERNDVHIRDALSTPNQRVYALPTAVGFDVHNRVALAPSSQRVCAFCTAVVCAAHYRIALSAP
ncbi:hypothetical protein PHMEG_00018128 [Phytophthora megakarya]|uniref:WRKY19-like zinc finger domain-containing protein n=1 Tax=Phytophthora megakarya TaxID=4795 RepID=A0A225VV27_9STRA|nr:hypothetical protein PHMEG_00018128 [Phytophthora megakarya]